jgi:DNA invertase Pin-like site-specific DNA recombinase
MDQFTGTTMGRPGMLKLMSDLQKGDIDTIVCWRLDRLGRTAAGLTALFEDLKQHKCNLISLKDNLDLSTPAGRLNANNSFGSDHWLSNRWPLVDDTRK